MNDSIWIIIAGALVAGCCGILGCFLILRKMAMVGDAISHAVLPGIVIAYLISGSRDTIWMLLGAGLTGILTTLLIEYFHKKARLQNDAAIGVTFTWLFAIGVILISLFAGQVDLDQECVLYGEIAYIPLDMITSASGVEFGPRVVWVMGTILIVLLIGLVLFYKELLLTTFDPMLAISLGYSAVAWHYILMAAVSFTTVAAFESVGAILVVALLVVNPAAAYLLTEKLKKMIALTLIFGTLTSVSGYWFATYFNVSIAGSMSVVAGLLFAISFLVVHTKKKLHSVPALSTEEVNNLTQIDSENRWA